LTSYQEALNRVLSLLNDEVPSCEEIYAHDSVGRVLAQDIISEKNIPERDKAVYDGYLIHSEDIKNASKENPVFLNVVGRIFPEDEPLEISRGQAIFTATGGPIPNGDYALIKVENTHDKDNNKIEIRFPLKSRENIAITGEDVKKGTIMFDRGHVIRPQDAGMLIGIGIYSVKVFRKPKVAIISIGNELISFEEKNKNPSKTVNNYAFIVSSLVKEFGGVPHFFDIVNDDMKEIKDKLTEALSENDIVLTISGCSLGPKDLVPDAISSLGKLVFHGIKLSPGKVVGAGVVNNKPVIMLPGHIASTFAGFYVITVPILAKYSGVNTGVLFPTVMARLSKDLKTKVLPYFLRVHLKKGEREFQAFQVSGGSSRLNILVGANGYSIIPARKEMKKGDVIEVVLFSRLELIDIQSKNV
jgi:molybdenum cofactor synthesis domain-containing protein